MAIGVRDLVVYGVVQVEATNWCGLAAPTYSKRLDL